MVGHSDDNVYIWRRTAYSYQSAIYHVTTKFPSNRWSYRPSSITRHPTSNQRHIPRPRRPLIPQNNPERSARIIQNDLPTSPLCQLLRLIREPYFTRRKNMVPFSTRAAQLRLIGWAGSKINLPRVCSSSLPFPYHDQVYLAVQSVKQTENL